MFRGLFQTKNKTKNNIVMHTEDLDMQNIPQHIAIIMDGNGRWAKAQGKVRTFGHQAGAETLKTIVQLISWELRLSVLMHFRQKTGSVR